MKSIFVGLLLLISVVVWSDRPVESGWYWITLEKLPSMVVYYSQEGDFIIMPGVSEILPRQNIKANVKWQGPITPPAHDSKKDSI